MNKYTITMPSLLLIPVLSILYAIIKCCGGTDWNWIIVLFFAPIITYFSWTMLYVMCMTFCLFLIKLISKNKV